MKPFFRRLRCQLGWHKKICVDYVLSPPKVLTTWDCEWCPWSERREEWAA
jgi:hypothetical protein